MGAGLCISSGNVLEESWGSTEFGRRGRRKCLERSETIGISGGLKCFACLLIGNVLASLQTSTIMGRVIKRRWVKDP